MARSPEGFAETTTLEGEETLTAYVKTKHGWTVGLGYPLRILEAPARRVMWQLGLAGGALTLLSLASGYGLARRISVSMAALREAARHVGIGKIVAVRPLAVVEANEIIEVLSTTSDDLIQARTDRAPWRGVAERQS